MNEYYLFVEKYDLLSTDKIQEITGLVNNTRVWLISLSKILTKMARSALTRFLSSGFPVKSNAYFVLSSLLSGVYCVSYF